MAIVLLWQLVPEAAEAALQAGAGLLAIRNLTRGHDELCARVDETLAGLESTKREMHAIMAEVRWLHLTAAVLRKNMVK